MQILQTLFYTAITLGVLVFIHEFGHFLAAKLTGMRVDRFSIGFPPRAFGKKIGDTDYCISWIPIGGYVKIAGMVDESMDTEFIDRAPEPWEFRSRPMSARMLVISAGVIMNILLAFAIFWGIHYFRGTYIRETTEIGYVSEGSSFAKAGLLAGDSILAINGTSVTAWDDLQNLLYIEDIGNDITLTIDRHGQQKSLFIPAKSTAPLSDAQPDLAPAHSVAVIEGVDRHTPAERLGLRAGDTLVGFNGSPAGYPAIVTLIRKHAGENISLSWKRGESVDSGSTTVSSEGRIGILLSGRYLGPFRQLRYSLIQAFPQAIAECEQSIHLFILTIGKIIAGKASVKESLGGPIAIAQMATQSAEAGFIGFIWFMAQLSMSLAIINIVPFPALDGGHLLLLVYEKAFRREIPNKVKIAIQQAGVIILLAFMAFVLYNDISKF